MPRQTSMSLEELKLVLAEGNTVDCSERPLCQVCSLAPMPRGLVYNEIGNIFLEDGEESVAAGEFLLQCLRGSDEEGKFYGYAYLSQATVKSPEVKTALKEFESNPENEETVKLVKNTKKRN